MIRRVGLVVIRRARTMASAGARLCNHVDAFCATVTHRRDVTLTSFAQSTTSHDVSLQY